MMRYLWTILLWLVLSTPSWAATYYVATTGSDSNTTTQAQDPTTPWRTIQKCLNNVTAGSTCTVADGTYTGGLDTVAAGTSGSPITLKSTNQYGANIVMPAVTDASNWGLRIDQSNYIVDGFEFSGAGGGGNVILGVNNTDIGIYGVSNTIIRNNKLHGVSRTICTNSDYGSQGIYVQGVSTLLIEKNQIYSIGRLLQGESGCGIDKHNHDHGIYMSGGSNVTIQGNVFYDTFRGWPIHIFGASSTTTNLNIYNNTMADNASVSNPGQILLAYTITNANIKNNICYNALSYCVAYSTAPSFTNVVVDHNLSTTAIDGGGRPSGMTFTNNLINQTASALFTSPATRDYTLKIGSPAINAGVNLTSLLGITTDLAGHLRPETGPWTAGAYEFIGLPPDLLAPTNPSNLTVTASNLFGRLDLSWTASTDNVAVLDYWVERCAGAGCASFFPVTSLAGTVLAETGLAPSTSYSYRVKARDTSSNFSGYSSEVSAITAPINFHLSLNLRRVSTDPFWMLQKECLDILAQEPVAPKAPLSMTAGQWREFEYAWMKWCNRKQDAC